MQGEDMAEQDLDRRSILLWSAGIPAAIALAARRAFASECAATQQDFLGPMYVPGAPRRSMLAPPNEPGERARIRGTVFSPDCKTPLSRALGDVWHADAKGHYQRANEADRRRGQMLTNDRGVYVVAS